MKKSRRAVADNRGASTRTLAVCIAHPQDNAALAACLASLAAHIGGTGAFGLQVVVVVDGPAPADFASTLWSFSEENGVPAQLLEQPHALGRARSLNAALEATAAAGHDLLLLDAAARLSSGSLSELMAVAATHLRAGFVAPRSTRGLFGALPAPQGGGSGPHAGADALEIVTRTLPRATAVPLLDAQCLFVRHAVLVDAGGLTAAFGIAAHHEWEWILRATDSGWLALLANHAAIDIADESISASAPPLNAASVSALQRLHPGLADALGWASASGTRLAERLLSGLLPGSQGQLRMAVDIAQVQPSSELDHRRLGDALAALVRQAAGRLQLTVLCEASTFRQLGLDRIEGLGRRQIASAGAYAVALEIIGRNRPLTAPGLVTIAPVLVPVFLTDEPVDRLLLRGGWAEHQALRRRLQHVNGFVVATGEDIGALRASLALGNHPPVIAHPGSTRLADHTMAFEVGASTHVLCIDDAAGATSVPPSMTAWAARFLDLPVVVAGRSERRGKPARVVDWQGATAALRRQLLSGAAVVVITTHRIAPLSWIGLALAAGKPLVLRESPGNRRQLAFWGEPRGVHWVGDGQDIAAVIIEAIKAGRSSVQADEGPDWNSWADTVIRFALEQVVSPDVYRQLLRRLDTQPGGAVVTMTLASVAPGAVGVSLSPVEQLLAHNDSEFLAGAYRMLLRREADSGGLARYQAALDRGLARADVLLSLCMSQEAVSLGGRPAEMDQLLVTHLSRIMSLDGRRFVDQAFATVLLRSADEPGLHHFSAQLEAGRGKLEILIDLARSDEGRATGTRPSIIMTLARQHEATTRHRIVTAG